MSIELKGVIKSFGHKNILNIDHFTFDNRIYRLNGPNGSGKTTLFRMITGLDKRFKGYISRDSRRTLYLTQKPIGVPSMSIGDNLLLLRSTFNIIPDHNQLTRTELLFNGMLDAPYFSASSGTKAKVGLSLLLFPDYWDLVLLDESFSAVDRNSLLLLSNSIIDISQKGNSPIIFIAHNLASPTLDAHSKLVTIEEGTLRC